MVTPTVSQIPSIEHRDAGGLDRVKFKVVPPDSGRGRVQVFVGVSHN